MSRFYNTLSQISKETKSMGLSYCECLEMSYENLREHTIQLEKKILKIDKVLHPKGKIK